VKERSPGGDSQPLGPDQVHLASTAWTCV